MVHFVPLPKLPSTKETAEVMLRHVFRLHGFPKDVVPDWGLQVASRFWKAFCSLLGATVSLTWEFHPESNGQTERLNQDYIAWFSCFLKPGFMEQTPHLGRYAHNTCPVLPLVSLSIPVLLQLPAAAVPSPEGGGQHHFCPGLLATLLPDLDQSSSGAASELCLIQENS